MSVLNTPYFSLLIVYHMNGKPLAVQQGVDEFQVAGRRVQISSQLKRAIAS